MVIGVVYEPFNLYREEVDTVETGKKQFIQIVFIILSIYHDSYRIGCRKVRITDWELVTVHLILIGARTKTFLWKGMLVKITRVLLALFPY